MDLLRSNFLLKEKTPPAIHAGRVAFVISAPLNDQTRTISRAPGS